MRPLALVVAVLAVACQRTTTSYQVDLAALAARSRSHPAEVRLVDGTVARGTLDADLAHVRLRFARREVVVPVRLVDTMTFADDVPRVPRAGIVLLSTVGGAAAGGLLGWSATEPCPEQTFEMDPLGIGRGTCETGRVWTAALGLLAGVALGALVGYGLTADQGGLAVRF
jgi:hypothetical protein